MLGLKPAHQLRGTDPRCQGKSPNVINSPRIGRRDVVCQGTIAILPTPLPLLAKRVKPAEDMLAIGILVNDDVIPLGKSGPETVNGVRGELVIGENRIE